MSQLLALSFDAPASPSMTLLETRRAGQPSPRHFGWGMAWYPPQDRSAVVMKDPIAIQENAMTRLLRDWERFRSTTFICHLRGAAQRVSQEDTQPFGRSYAGREWIMAHNGQLRHDFSKSLKTPLDPMAEPIGRTDTEYLLCWLLGRLKESGVRELAKLDPDALHALFDEVNAFGTLNLLLSDGQSMVIYQDAANFNPLHWTRRVPPNGNLDWRNDEVELRLGAQDGGRTIFAVATEPLSATAWQRMRPGQLLLVRRGEIVWDSEAAKPTATNEATADAATSDAGTTAVAPATALRQRGPTARTPQRQELDVEALLRVTHETVYRYKVPVEQSEHLLRLRPVHDSGQHVLHHSMRIEPASAQEQFEDVFGNTVLRLEPRLTYQEMRLISTSIVRVLPPGNVVPRWRRTTIPLDWMPWQRQMMSPYLLPPELPESQLRELFLYGMSFVDRQDFDLVAALQDMNRTIQRDFSYAQGATTLATTPYQVYTSRRGVCRDFATLFITLSRMLGVPARYRVGYIYTGADYINQAQSEASHAWVEVYLPWAGWRGFDPTNGSLAGLDHVRVACGRNYSDATPTSGTIYRGGGSETLDVSVQVERLDAPPPDIASQR